MIRDRNDIPHWRVSVRFVRQGCWIGLYWKRTKPQGDQGQLLGQMLRVYVCIVPCFPIIVSRWSQALAPSRENDLIYAATVRCR